MNLQKDAMVIIRHAIQSVLPGPNVKETLRNMNLGMGKVIVIAVGKAGFTMAKAAEETLGDRIDKGLVVTKYDHMKEELLHFESVEAGHPVPDGNSVLGAKKAMEMVQNLNPEDHVIFLLSGGASALFEAPLIDEDEMARLTSSLLASGADIREINTVRKHLSKVKGGRFALEASPAYVDTIILSDVLGNDLSSVGSGPTVADETTGDDAFRVLNKYHIAMSSDTMLALQNDTPKSLEKVTYHMVGDIHILCDEAKKAAEHLGYECVLLSDSITCEAREAGAFMASVAKTYQYTEKPLAFLIGGETIVHLKGTGKGGRNQEMALSASLGLDGLTNTCFFSVGSDGTDGPTDAAGGYVDGNTVAKLKSKGIDPEKYLENNDAYSALKEAGLLIMTGPTGTNVNDFSMLLIGR